MVKYKRNRRARGCLVHHVHRLRLVVAHVPPKEKERKRKGKGLPLRKGKEGEEEHIRSTHTEHQEHKLNTLNTQKTFKHVAVASLAQLGRPAPPFHPRVAPHCQRELARSGCTGCTVAYVVAYVGSRQGRGEVRRTGRGGCLKGSGCVGCHQSTMYRMRSSWREGANPRRT
eukprot:scaffold53868_cov66-Phaeocystis_antarctica.AAC.3